jgi:hypothetical protein
MWHFSIQNRVEARCLPVWEILLHDDIVACSLLEVGVAQYRVRRDRPGNLLTFGCCWGYGNACRFIKDSSIHPLD